ncbi:MAG: CNNM domain-containing protein [Eubacterium sp.]|nr:CNNM domain-containing protein [Eubacterium sp.]
MNTGILCAMIVLVLASSFFSGAETSFSSLNRVKLKTMISEGKSNKRIERTLALAEDYDIVLSTVLILSLIHI